MQGTREHPFLLIGYCNQSHSLFSHFFESLAFQNILQFSPSGVLSSLSLWKVYPKKKKKKKEKEKREKILSS